VKLDSVSRVHVLRTLDREFGASLGESVTKCAAIAEYLRAVLTLKAAHDVGRYPVPISTASVTTEVRRHLSLLWPDLSDALAKDDAVVTGIEHLSSVGEIVRTGSSQWIPAPDRAVYIDEHTRLLLSSKPLQLLTFRLRRSIQTIGRARVVDVRESDSTKSIVIQGLREWMQCRYNEIEDWGNEFVANSATKLSAVEGLENGEVFLGGRWCRTESLTNPASGIQLYRRRVYIYGNAKHEYALCRLATSKSGGIDVSAALVIEKNDARRLQGAVRFGDGRRRVIKIRCDAGIATLFLLNPLPHPENAFLSLGWVCPEQEPKEWPKKYLFSERLVPLLKAALRLLGYDTVEQ
jgi:hypothetical protein